jgi:hypothetical protein
MCVNDTIVVHDTKNLALRNYIVKNLFMRSDDIRVRPVRDPARQDTTIYVSPIEVYGGGRDFTVVSRPAWVLEDPVIVVVDGESRMKIRVSRQPDETVRNGVIRFAHKDDPDYTIDVNIRQAFFTDTPPFDYFVMRFSWGAGSSGDLDIMVEFVDNFKVDENGDEISPKTNISFDNTNTATANSNTRVLGYGRKAYFNKEGVVYPTGPTTTSIGWLPEYSQSQLTSNLMLWGGDAMRGQGETVFFNAPQITPDFTNSDVDTSGLPRLINIDVYAYRYAQKSVKLEIFTYKGGLMQMPAHDYGVGKVRSYNFYNIPSYGSPLQNLSDTRPPVFSLTAEFRDFAYSHDELKSWPGATGFRTYPRMCRIVYDRWANRVHDIIWSTTHENGYVDQDLWIDDGSGFVKHVAPQGRSMPMLPLPAAQVAATQQQLFDDKANEKDR